MTFYEYKRVFASGRSDRDEDLMNKLGAVGWRFVEIDSPFLVFERELPERRIPIGDVPPTPPGLDPVPSRPNGPMEPERKSIERKTRRRFFGWRA